MKMELSKDYYSLDECSDRNAVTKRLDKLENEGKIYYDIDVDMLEIEDLDMDDKDIEDLEDLLDSCDVFPYLERDSEDEEYDDLYDEDEDY